MSQTLVELFQRTINRNLHLNRTDEIWSLNDPPQIKIRAPSQHSLGFSLDCDSSPLSGLFSANPPLNIAKMCDGIIVLSHKNNAYIFVVEQKTANKDKYKKQLANGKYFCDWLLALLKEHDYYDGKVVFISLLCWFPQEKLPRKGTSHLERRATSKKLGPCHWFFEVKNKTDIHLLDFIK